MGVARGCLNLLLRESQRRSFSGSIVTLGRQDVYFDSEFVFQRGRDYGVPIRQPVRIEPTSNPILAPHHCISDRTLFEMLGFSECLALDYSDYEGAQVVFDLNEETLPEELSGRFDVVFDGGTMEHVFHLPNLLRHLHGMLKVGGRVIHLSPSSNHMDHGFYMFSPTLFYDYYRVNEYEVSTIQVIRYSQAFNDRAWEVYAYDPGCLRRLAFGGLDDGMYAVLCVATKREASTAGRIPQQGMYASDLWVQARRSGASGEGSAPAGTTPSARPGRAVPEGVKRLPGIRLLYRGARGAWRRLSRAAAALSGSRPVEPARDLGLSLVDRA